MLSLIFLTPVKMRLISRYSLTMAEVGSSIILIYILLSSRVKILIVFIKKGFEKLNKKEEKRMADFS